MADQKVRIGYVSPRAQRRKAQAQRRSMCCCSLMLLASLLIAILAFRGVFARIFHREARTDESRVTFPLTIETERSWYYRYHLIPVAVKAVDASGTPQTGEPPAVIVRRDGERVRNIGPFNELKLHYDHTRAEWVGFWPVPWNATPGIYVLEAKTEIDPGEWEWTLDGQRPKPDDDDDEPEPEGMAWAVATAPFEVKARARAQIEPGLCVATWEFDFRETFTGPDGSSGDWKKLFDWIEYPGADALGFRGALTEGSGLTIEKPFKSHNLEAIPRMGAEAHRRGIKFGTWAVAYSTYPKGNARKPPYDFAMDISRSTGVTSERPFISLLDERRVTALTEFFRQMQEMDEVDMVGLDYMRTDRGGYEMVDQFAAEMPVKLPDNWGEWSANRRQRYVANKVEGEWQTDPKFYECWNWWRAHKGAEIARKIVDDSGVQKPTWIFVLTWLHGVQHGQDPLMFTDAGISMLAPMLYQVDNRGMYDEVVKAWANYIQPGQLNIVPGDQVDFYWHQKMVSPTPATAEMYDRLITAHREFSPGEPQIGAFWHDLNRAANPANRGPYSGREWALAGAAAFSTIRDSWDVYPLRVTLDAPDTQTIASTFTVTVNIENLTKRDVKNIRVAVCDTPLIVPRGLTRPDDDDGEHFTRVKNLDGNTTIQVPVQIRISRASAERANRAMAAIRVTWDEASFAEPVRNDLPRQIVVMKYIKGT